MTCTIAKMEHELAGANINNFTFFLDQVTVSDLGHRFILIFTIHVDARFELKTEFRRKVTSLHH